MSGKFFLIIGPSGSGKGTLVDFIRTNNDELGLVFPVSCTTRERRPGEKEGKTYYFVSEEEFKERIDKEEFLEWAEYGGNLYGTLKSEIVDPLKAGQSVLREVEIQGANSIMNLFSRKDLFVIYIDAGSWEKMERRIKARAPIGEEELRLRKERFEKEIKFKEEADFVIENHDGKLLEARKSLLNKIKQTIRNLQGTSREVKM